jgi:putative ABC transport system ATP-binding protein
MEDDLIKSKPLVAVQSVTKVYKLGEITVPALRGLDLEIHEGEFAAIWGPSGSGKTTLLNLIGLIDTPSSGRVLVAGRDTASVSDDSLAEMRNRYVGFVFQTFNLVPVLTALENVQLPLQIRGISQRKSRSAAEELLEQVGLASLAGARPDQMSGGQRQRVAIARALVTSPAIVLADEPTANLDSETGQQIVDLMRHLNRTRRVTFVFATHDPKLLDGVSRNIYLADGTIVEDQSKVYGRLTHVPA